FKCALVSGFFRAKGNIGGVRAELLRRAGARQKASCSLDQCRIKPAGIADQSRNMSHAMHAANRAVFIAGPTASGKSALAFALAEQVNGVVINADSMQVYRDLRIITARPTPAEEARVPHLLYGHVDAAENYSVGHWCRDAERAFSD